MTEAMGERESDLDLISPYAGWWGQGSLPATITLFGSAPMLAHGPLPNIGDINIMARGSV